MDLWLFTAECRISHEKFNMQRTRMNILKWFYIAFKCYTESSITNRVRNVSSKWIQQRTDSVGSIDSSVGNGQLVKKWPDSLLLYSQNQSLVIFMSRWIKSTTTLFLNIQFNVRPSTTSFSKWSLPLKFVKYFFFNSVTAETFYAKITVWSYGFYI
jgi:hypothetical protein